MKRRVLTIIVFPLLGAVVNVAVAWAFGYWGAMLESHDVHALLDPEAENDQYVICSYGTLDKGVGTQRIRMSTAFIYVTNEWNRISGSLPNWVPSDIRMKWGTAAWRSDETIRDRIILVEGWPALALWCEVDGHEHAIGGIVAFSRSGLGDKRAVALRPLWPGFAINTLFYAAILWGFFAAPFALRRRRRIKRGLCPACAYPIGKSAVCTECGVSILREGA